MMQTVQEPTADEVESEFVPVFQFVPSRFRVLVRKLMD